MSWHGAAAMCGVVVVLGVLVGQRDVGAGVAGGRLAGGTRRTAGGDVVVVAVVLAVAGQVDAAGSQQFGEDVGHGIGPVGVDAAPRSRCVRAVLFGGGLSEQVDQREGGGCGFGGQVGVDLAHAVAAGQMAHVPFGVGPLLAFVGGVRVGGDDRPFQQLGQLGRQPVGCQGGDGGVGGGPGARIQAAGAIGDHPGAALVDAPGAQRPAGRGQFGDQFAGVVDAGGRGAVGDVQGGGDLGRGQRAGELGDVGLQQVGIHLSVRTAGGTAFLAQLVHQRGHIAGHAGAGERRGEGHLDRV
jgi:hypothetical protein